MGWKRLSALAACSALLLALSGCGADPKPKFTKEPSSSVSANGSSSPTPREPTPPKMPATARKHTVAGAKAFARYAIAASNYGSDAADPAPLAAIVSQHCDGCHAALRFIAKLARRNAKVRGGHWVGDSLNVKQLAAGAERFIRVTIRGHTDRQVITYPSGHRDVYPATTRVTVQLTILERHDGWVIDRWEVL